jgi:hypothetical protein
MGDRWTTGGIRPFRRHLARALWIALLTSSSWSCNRSDGVGEEPGGGRAGVEPSSYLYVWAADDDGSESDFVAVIDVRPDSPTYAKVITTLAVGFGGGAHHTEHVMPEGGTLLANAFDAGLTFLIDFNDPGDPSLAGYFAEAGEYHHPHSFERLPNGNIVATFQRRSRRGEAGSVETGGLVELDPSGRPVRSGSAAVPELDPTIRPYSLCLVPELDRVVTTSTDMAGVLNRAVQIRRLSDLSLRNTLVLEPGDLGSEHLGTAEPRLLADGRTVLVSTFSCGLYKLDGLSGQPEAKLVYTFPQQEGTYCALPIVTGSFWIQTVPAEHALVTLDIADPDRPVEVARLTLEPDDVPHWISLEPSGDRIVITGYAGLAGRVLLARLDHETGEIELEEGFGPSLAGRPGVDLRRASWPHGDTGPAAPHGAVFSRG